MAEVNPLSAADVAPFVGAWIEICIFATNFLVAFGSSLRGCVGWTCDKLMLWVHQIVAPFVGAWIEMILFRAALGCYASLPSWERGLKFFCLYIFFSIICRSLRGSVD